MDDSTGEDPVHVVLDEESEGVLGRERETSEERRSKFS